MLADMVEFTGKDLSGSRFEGVDLRRARFEDVDLGDAWLRNVHLTGAHIRGARGDEVEIDGSFETLLVNGDVERLLVNGVDVAPFVEAELDRRDPAHLRVRQVERVVRRGVAEQGAPDPGVGGEDEVPQRRD